MAKIYTENLTISLSKIFKGDKEPESLMDESQAEIILQTIEEIINDKTIIVEVKVD